MFPTCSSSFYAQFRDELLERYVAEDISKLTGQMKPLVDQIGTLAVKQNEDSSAVNEVRAELASVRDAIFSFARTARRPTWSIFVTCRFPTSGSSRASFAHVGVAMDNPAPGSGYRSRRSLKRLQRNRLRRSRRDSHFFQMLATSSAYRLDRR